MGDRSAERAFPDRRDASLHRDTYRIFCFLAGVLSPAFGVIYHFTNPEALDPLWVRSSVALPMLLLLSLSYMNGWVKAHFIRIVQGSFYLLTAYFIGVTILNDFSPNYALGALFAMTGIGVAFSLGLQQVMRPLTIYLCSAVGMYVAAAWLAPDPAVSPAIMSVSVLSTALVIYVAAYSKIQAEKTTAATEKRYQTLMDSASDPIFIADAEEDLIVGANRKAQELLGRSLDEIQRMRPGELFPPDKQEHYEKLFRAHVYDDEPIEEPVYLVKRSGERVPVDIKASLATVGGEQLIQGIFRDATERQRYERQLIEAKERAEELLQLKSSFLNNMSHELRTPLTSILGYAEILAEETGERGGEFAQQIARSGKRLQNTLDSVLDLAQLESGETELDLKPVDLPEEVEESVDLLEPMASQKGLTLKTRVATSCTHVRADEAFIHRIVNNLVGNAIKFTKEGSVIVEVGARTEEDQMFMRVTDTGVGIDAEFKENLFDEFRQESSGLKRTHEGSGLGLAITKRLVDLLDGAIEVKSQKGIGSTFTVLLPHAPEAEGEASSGGGSSNGVSSNGELPRSTPAENEVLADAALPPSANGQGEADQPMAAPQQRVLVLEDNPSTRELVDYRLRSVCQVEKASSPEEALHLARRTNFDAVMLDIHLSAERNGIEVLHALRSMPDYQDVPAVALTAYALPTDRERFLEEGFNLHLPKPFTTEQLFEALGQVLVWPTAPRALS